MNFENDRVNMITESTRIEGTISFDDFAKFDAYLVGTLKTADGTEVIIGKNGVVEGTIEADRLIIDGFVRGRIIGKTSVKIASTGRVVGDIVTKNFSIDFGAFFEGECKTPNPLLKESPHKSEKPA